jgi:hypothetical protein
MYLLGTTFVLGFSKILSALSRASTSNIEKMAKYSKFYGSSYIFSKDLNDFIACKFL